MMKATAVALFLLVLPALASENARPILDRRAALEKGARWWDDRYQRMKIVIHDSGSARRQLELDVHDLRLRNLQQKSLAVFRAPADKAGTAFLGYTKLGAPGQQWLYVPESRRTRQITGDYRHDRFQSTDFTYHDLDLLADMPFWTEEDARSDLADPETIDAIQCHRISLEPQRDYIKYTRIVLWLGIDDLVPRQVEFFAEPLKLGMIQRGLIWLFGSSEEPELGQPVRRFRQWDIRWVGSIPVAHRIEAQTVQHGSRTEIEVTEVQFNQGLGDDFFSPCKMDKLG